MSLNFEEFDKEIHSMPAKVQASLRKIAVQVGHTAEADFEGHFNEQGMNGKKWKEVNRRKPGTKEYKYPKTKDLQRRKRNILISKNATLKKSVGKSYKGFTAEKDKVTVHMRVDEQSGKEHAIYLQEGTEKMVARPFVGETPELDNKITGIIEDNINLDK